jgi:hypothetical protein
MKNYFIFLAAMLFVLSSCTNNDDSIFKLDPSATISLNPAPVWKSTKAKMASGYLTPLQVVKQVGDIEFYNYKIYGNEAVGRGFSGPQRDTITPKLKMWGTDIIDQEGKYVPDFIEAEDLVLRRYLKINIVTKEVTPRIMHPITGGPMDILNTYERETSDTIGYIPNSIMRSAESRIKAAYEAQDNEAVYNIFNDTFVFYPITGKEWLALKAQNLQ